MPLFKGYYNILFHVFLVFSLMFILAITVGFHSVVSQRHIMMSMKLVLRSMDQFFQTRPKQKVVYFILKYLLNYYTGILPVYYKNK